MSVSLPPSHPTNSIDEQTEKLPTPSEFVCIETILPWFWRERVWWREIHPTTPTTSKHITYRVRTSTFTILFLLQQTPTMTMLNKITTFLLVLVAAATNLATTSTAFTTTQSLAVLRQGDAASRHSNPAAIGPSTFQVIPSPSSSSTNSHSALQLKVKVDPDAKKTKNTAGNAKMAAYGGSVVIALLLPIAFLVWSAVSK